MIQLTAQMRILVAVASIDFRAGIDGLARICRAQFEADPFCGWLFVFCNRRRTAVKLLTYDGQPPVHRILKLGCPGITRDSDQSMPQVPIRPRNSSELHAGAK